MIPSGLWVIGTENGVFLKFYGTTQEEAQREVDRLNKLAERMGLQTRYTLRAHPA